MIRCCKSLFAAAAACSALGFVSVTQDHSKGQDAKAPVAQAPTMFTPADVKWVDAPAFPPGAQMATLAGDPSKPDLFTMRAKFAANYKIPPHFHSVAENVTVISGTLYVAVGDTFDAAKAKALPAGSFGVIPAKTHHFAYTKEETVVQLNCMGPFDLIYVNPADDPSKKGDAKK